MSRECLEQARPGLKGRAGCRQQQKRARGLKQAYKEPVPTAAAPTSAICVELAPGMPTWSRTASAVIPMVRPATMTNVSASVARAKRRRVFASS
jgi:hypothetical protein